MPIVPTGAYYSPSLVSMGAQGAFEGALGGLDKVYAQDLARERLRGLREERQFRTAERAAALQGGLIQDPLAELMAGGGGGVPKRSGGGGRYSTARERSAGQAGPISRVDAEEAARYQHELALVDRALREYQSAQSDYLGAGGPPPRARVGTERPDYEATPADMALALQRDASLEDEGTRRLRAALFQDQGGDAKVLISPLVNEYREGLAGMSGEAFEAEDLRGLTEGAYRDAMSLDPAGFGGFDEWISERSPEGEGWSREGDPITKFASSLGDESVDPRSAPPALQAIEESIRTTKSPRDRKVLERAYGQLQRGVALDAKARRSGNYEAQMEAGTQIEQAMSLLDPNLVSAMGLARPEFGAAFDENLPESEVEYRRKMEMYTDSPISRWEMTPGYEGIWNPSVDIGLAATTILDPSTLSAIGSLADDGNPMAKRMLGRLGAEPVSAQEAIKKGLVGDVVEFRSKLAAHLNEEQQLLKGAGVDDDERAKAFLLGLIKIHGPGSFSVDNPDDLAMARGAVDMHPSAQKVFLDQLFHAKAQGGKEELERLKAKTAGVTRRVMNTTAGGGRKGDIQLHGQIIDSIEKSRKQLADLRLKKSDAAYTPEKFPEIEIGIAEQLDNIKGDTKRLNEVKEMLGWDMGGGDEPPPTVLKLQQRWLETDDIAEQIMIEDELKKLGVGATPKAGKRSGRNQNLKPDMAKVAKGFRKKTKGMTGDKLRTELKSLYDRFDADSRWDDAAMREVEGVIESILAEDQRIRWSVGGHVINP